MLCTVQLLNMCRHQTCTYTVVQLMNTVTYSDSTWQIAIVHVVMYDLHDCSKLFLAIIVGVAYFYKVLLLLRLQL